MLYILTGKVQAGKSRWLEERVKTLGAEGIECYGVISAGIWIRSDSEYANSQGFEKLGIESILLPKMERFEFAKRKDLAKANGSFNQRSQAGKVGLGWHISDEAIARVNAHFAWIAKQIKADKIHGMLVVDELGRLELDHNAGLLEAMKLLEAGASDNFPNAIVVARRELTEKVVNRFASKWGGSQTISL
ncbi:hypothetical protein [Adlercreutzia sp. ZJ304]|uniref:hypothetical protein n=1 Tax=Adlercreutzia sp. ZJ304 TaxID=2709791 RepID=UPI0013EE1736|nr:hypothetical protein [Adlercreutzia sp. ZJ304]